MVFAATGSTTTTTLATEFDGFDYLPFGSDFNQQLISDGSTWTAIEGRVGIDGISSLTNGMDTINLTTIASQVADAVETSDQMNALFESYYDVSPIGGVVPPISVEEEDADAFIRGIRPLHSSLDAQFGDQIGVFAVHGRFETYADFEVFRFGNWQRAEEGDTGSFQTIVLYDFANGVVLDDETNLAPVPIAESSLLSPGNVTFLTSDGTPVAFFGYDAPDNDTQSLDDIQRGDTAAFVPETGTGFRGSIDYLQLEDGSVIIAEASGRVLPSGESEYTLALLDADYEVVEEIAVDADGATITGIDIRLTEEGALKVYVSVEGQAETRVDTFHVEGVTVVPTLDGTDADDKIVGTDASEIITG